MTVLSLQQQAARIVATRRRLPPRRLTPSVFVARALVVRALRHAGLHHVLRREPCTFGIAGVDEGSVDAISSAVRDIMGADIVANYGFDVTIYDRTENRRRSKGGLASIVVNAAKGGERACVLFGSEEAVPEAFLASAEGVVNLARIGRRVLKGAFMATVKRSPDPAGLDVISSLPLGLLDSVVTAGRSVERSVKVARRLLAALEAVAEPVEPAAISDPEAIVEGIRLEDLSGLGDVGEWGSDLVRDLDDYRKGRIPWSDVDRGILVAGPPGVGKTLFAGALGRSCGVPVHVHSCASWQARGHLGDLLKAMSRAFGEARKAAPCIVFLDEMDAFGSRSDPGDRYAAYSRQVIDGLLQELDGAVSREGIVVVGATNHPELIDPALLRPGRLERVLHMRLPDATARVGILRHHVRNSLEAADLRPLAERLDGATGAEIELLVRDGRRRARKRRQELTLVDLEAGLPPQRALSPALVWRACVHEAGHVVVGTRLAAVSGWKPIGASVPRHGIGRAETVFEPDHGIDATADTLRAGIVVLLAGAAAEEVLIGSRGAGSGGTATSDLVRATDMAASIEAVFGLGSTLTATHGEPSQVRQVAAGFPASAGAVERTLCACMAEAKALVAAEREVVAATARALERDGRVGAPVRSGVPPVVPLKDSGRTPAPVGEALPRPCSRPAGGDGGTPAPGTPLAAEKVSL